MTTSLRTIQAQFQDYVLGPADDAPAIADDIMQQVGLSAPERLAIYYNGYRLRLCETLSKAYDKTHAYVGDEMFEDLCLGYLARHPSHSPNLRWYGAQFAGYVAERLPDHRFVAELAAFEWQLSVAFDAEDVPVLGAEDVAAIAPEAWDSIGFSLQPSMHVLPMVSNAVAIWLALDKEETPPEPGVAEAPVDWLIWRKELQPHFRSVSALEAQALRGLGEGKSFSRVCEEAAEAANDDEIMTRIAGWLQIWLTEQILSEIRPSSEAAN